MDKVEYKPGESGVIVAHYNTGGHTGIFRKSIRVKSNSVKDGDLRLVLKGSTYAELEVENTTLFFYHLVPGVKETFAVPVINKMNKPLEIRGVKFKFPFNANQYFSIKAKVVRGKNNKEVIRFELLPKKTAYQFRSSSLSVEVKTNSKQVPVITFYLRVRIKRVVEINPTALFLYTKVNGKTEPATIDVSTELNSGLKIKKISCRNCPLKFKIISISKKSKQILVTPDYSKQKKGFFSGIIKVLIDCKGIKEYSIPVRGRF